MLAKTYLTLTIVTCSFVLANGQTSSARPGAAGTPATRPPVHLRDIPFPGGVDLQFLIKELARDLDMNVLFDPEIAPRKARVELRNVTAASAIDYILLQEGLCFEEAGPRTIFITARTNGNTVPQLGVGIIVLSDQLADYFGVTGGLLVNAVRADSPAAKAEIKAGDVIVAIDGLAVKASLGLIRTIENKKEGDVKLTVVRDHQSRSIILTPTRGVRSVL